MLGDGSLDEEAIPPLRSRRRRVGLGLALLIVIALAAGLEGYWLRSATWLERGLLLGAAFLLIDPALITDLVGVGLLGMALLMQKLRRPDAAVPVRTAS